MKVLIVIGNPNTPKSFCHRLANEAKQIFEKNKGEVKISDLYSQKFHACGGMDDFTETNNTEYFDYQMEQKHTIVKRNFDTFTPEVRTEIENIKWCDFMFFVFPLYWYNVPGIIKCYQDRILAHCFAYGHGGRATLRPRKVSYLTTTGSPTIERGGKNSVELLRKTYYFGFEEGLKETGLEMVDPFFVFGSTFYQMKKDEKTGRYTQLLKATEKNRIQWIEDFKLHIEKNYVS